MTAKFQKHTERVQRIERYIKKNKLFCFFAAILIIFLVVTQVKDNLFQGKEPKTSISTEIDTDKENESDSTNADTVHWRFYSIDLWILLIGGEFCSIMIVRERRKTKEKLQ